MKKSIEERMKEAKSILFDRPMMLLTKPIESLENRIIEEKCTGYKVRINNLSYRGIWVSTIEDIEMNIDGESVPKKYDLSEFKWMSISGVYITGTYRSFLGIEDEAELWVNKVGGLSKGSHIVEIAIKKRQDFGHSYGEGEEGYESAIEFTCPVVMKDCATFEI